MGMAKKKSIPPKRPDFASYVNRPEAKAKALDLMPSDELEDLNSDELAELHQLDSVFRDIGSLAKGVEEFRAEIRRRRSGITPDSPANKVFKLKLDYPNEDVRNDPKTPAPNYYRKQAKTGRRGPKPKSGSRTNTPAKVLPTTRRPRSETVTGEEKQWVNRVAGRYQAQFGQQTSASQVVRAAGDYLSANWHNVKDEDVFPILSTFKSQREKHGMMPFSKLGISISEREAVPFREFAERLRDEMNFQRGVSPGTGVRLALEKAMQAEDDFIEYLQNRINVIEKKVEL